MTENASFEILHLDDQPPLVAWIPRDIRTSFWATFQNEMAAVSSDDDGESRDECTFNLQLRAGGEILDTRYRIVCWPEELIRELDAIPSDRVVLILLDQAIGTNQAAGSDTWSQIKRMRPEILDRVFILTAYPNLVYGQLGWAENSANLIIKPASTEKILEIFVKCIIEVAKLKHATKQLLSSIIDQ